MSDVAVFQFNPFAENTYVVSDETKECVIIDPGCQSQTEKNQLDEYIESNELKPVRLLLTHAHVDHVFGNKHVYEKYGLRPELHEKELPVLKSSLQIAQMYGLPFEESPEPESFIEAGTEIKFGNTTFQTLYTPGHSPASISFYVSEEDYVIAGDVLFRESIGRTDLPGGDFNTLINSIKEKLFTLPDHTRVYSGHGPSTDIAHEKRYNPFLR